MTAARICQQVRLWTYCALLVLTIGTSRELHGYAFAVAAIALVLFWLEMCQQCGKLAWAEKGWWPSGAGPLWIGACKNCPLPEGANDERGYEIMEKPE